MNSTFVTRDLEQKFLDNLLNKALATNSVQVCLIAGDRGDGKTTLVEHFADTAQTQLPNLNYAIGVCQEITKAKSYEPFHNIFSQLTGLRARELQSALGGEQEFDLKRKIQIATKTLIEITPELIGVFVPGVSLLTKAVGIVSNQIIERRIEASKDSNISEEQLKIQCVRFFNKLSQKSPLIIIFDDFQWIDQLSFKLLQHLINSLHDSPVLIALTYRPDEISEELQFWMGEVIQTFGDITIDLRAISQTDGGQKFVEDFLKHNRCKVDVKFREEFYKRTEAKPLFAVELLHYLKNSEVLTESSLGIYEQNPELTYWTEIPAHITKLKALIESRIRLIQKDNEELLKILQIASVEGFQFTAQVLVHLTGESELSVLETLSNYLDKKYGLIKEVGEEIVGSATVSRFRFANILYQEHIYSSMGASVRRVRHGEVALALEKLYGEDLGQIAILLAEHFERANKARKASEYLLMFGKQQLANRKIGEGITILEKALGLARVSDYTEGIIDSQRYLAMELVNKKIHHEAEQLFEDTIKLARKQLDRHPRSVNVLSALSYSLRGLGRVRRSQRRNSEAMYMYMEELSIATNQINDPGLAGACLNNIGVLVKEEGRFEDAIRFYEQRVQIAEDINDVDGMLVSYINLGNTYRAIGKVETAKQYLTKGLGIVSEREDWLRESGIKISFAYAESKDGNLKQAAIYLLQALDLVKHNQHLPRIIESLVCAADILGRTKYILSAAKLIGYLEARVDERADFNIVKDVLARRMLDNLDDAMEIGVNSSLDELQNEVESYLRELANK